MYVKLNSRRRSSRRVFKCGGTRLGEKEKIVDWSLGKARKIREKAFARALSLGKVEAESSWSLDQNRGGELIG